jgi:hypothetical protein
VWASQAPPVRFSRQPQSQIQVSQQKSRKNFQILEILVPRLNGLPYLDISAGFFSLLPELSEPPHPHPPPHHQSWDLSAACVFLGLTTEGGVVGAFCFSSCISSNCNTYIFPRFFIFMYSTLYSIYVHHLRNKRYIINTINLTSNKDIWRICCSWRVDGASAPLFFTKHLN